jgi:polyisoprenoid-binding protein YceI
MRARTDLILAAGALRGRSMLDAGTYPRLRFASTAVRPSPSGRLSDGARIEGRLTIRDVTRDITLDATLTRAAGTAPDDLRELTIRLSGHVSRAAFGVTGYPDVVGDIVTLDIVATLLADA